MVPLLAGRHGADIEDLDGRDLASQKFAGVRLIRHVCQPLRRDEPGRNDASRRREQLVLPVRIELTTSPLPMECSTTELRQHHGRRQRISDQRPDVEPFGSRLAGAAARPIDKAWERREGSKGRPIRRPEGRCRARRTVAGGAAGKSQAAQDAGQWPDRQTGERRPTIPPESCRTSPRIRPIILRLRSGGGGAWIAFASSVAGRSTAPSRSPAPRTPPCR